MGPRATGLAAGKDSRQGPTADMLRTYYRSLLILSGDLKSGILGPFVNRGADDVALLRDFLTNPAPAGTTPRAIYIGGDGFVQSEYATGSTGTFSSHLALLTDDLGVTIKQNAAGFPQYSYQPWSGNLGQYASLEGSSWTSGTFSLGNDCAWGNDVLDVVSNGLGAEASGHYENTDSHGPYVSGVHTPAAGGKFYESFVDGWDARHLFTSTAVDPAVGTAGRHYYFSQVLSRLLGPTCGITLPFTLDAPWSSSPQLRDFMSLWNNPLVSGEPAVRLGLAKPDRVRVALYDVAGRRVRLLADRSFPAGEHSLAWDGADDQGRRLARGVYFARVRYARSGFEAAKKLVILR